MYIWVNINIRDVFTMKKLTFGIYPGGATGTDTGHELVACKKPNDPTQINLALAKLQTAGQPFLIRCYLHYLGLGKFENLTPEDPLQFIADGRKLDLVLGYHSVNGDITDWAKFIREQIAFYGNHLAKIQITEEPNLHGFPAVDGDYPNVRLAVIHGVIAAKNEIVKLGLAIEVGFNGVPTFDPKNDFWRELGSRQSAEFIRSLDYVGLDFFPDVFRPVALDDLHDAVVHVLSHYRNVSLREAGIPTHVPIHITENGWATSTDRPDTKQAEVLEMVVRTIYENRELYNITHYELFDLRDADSSNPNIFYQFGIMRDDYSPKPAFVVYKKLIVELGN